VPTTLLVADDNHKPCKLPTCYWKGCVHSTCSSLLLTSDIQSELVRKSPEFSDLVQLLTKVSNNNGEILDGTTTPGLEETIQQVISSL
jgi:hypothetical protein